MTFLAKNGVIKGLNDHLFFLVFLLWARRKTTLFLN